MSNSIDILIIGGGLAGLSSAISLAKDGFNVTLVEATTYTSFRVGEHLTPDALHILKELSIPKSLYQSSPTITSIWGNTKLHTANYIFSLYGNGVALSRPNFDLELSKVAKEFGVRLYLGTRVQNLIFDNGEWNSTIFNKIENRHFNLRSDFIIDASGRASIVSKVLGRHLIKYDKLVGFGCMQDSEDKYHNPLIESVKEGWWYSAYLTNKKHFTMLLTDIDLLPLKRKSFWLNSLKNSVEVKKRFNFNANIRIRGFNASTSRLLKPCGARWMAIGDSAIAFDPLSSGGIAKALLAGIKTPNWVKRFLSDEKGVKESYQAEIERDVTNYFERRSRYYKMENRFLDSVFWYRRHLPPLMKQPIFLSPEINLMISPNHNEKSLKNFLNGIAPTLNIKKFLRVTSTPKSVIELVKLLQLGQPYGYPNQEKLSILQLLVMEGCLQLANVNSNYN